MLAAIRILFILGFRRVFLLGVDFKMDAKTTYHFEQSRHSGSINGNTKTYGLLNERFDELRPLFEQEDFYVFNCNPESGLKSFDHVSYEDAVKDVLAEFGDIDLANERTEGLYNHNSREKQAGRGR